MFDRPNRLVALAPIVAAVLGVVAGCGGDDDPAEEAGTTQAVTTAPPQNSAQRTVGGGDRSCTMQRQTSARGGQRHRMQEGWTGAGPAGRAAGRCGGDVGGCGRDVGGEGGDRPSVLRGVEPPGFPGRHTSGSQGLLGSLHRRFRQPDRQRDSMAVTGLLRFMRQFPRTVGGQFAVERTFDMGERLGVIVTRKGPGAESGAPLSLRSRQVWTFRDSKVIRVKILLRPEGRLGAQARPPSDSQRSTARSG